MSRLRNALVAVLLLWAAPTQAAIVHVQNDECTGDDCTITSSPAWTSGNQVFVACILTTESETCSITGEPNGPEVTVVGPLDSPANVRRIYLFCFTGDGADTQITMTTSGAGSSDSVAIEVSGAVCETPPDDSESNDDTDDANYQLTTDLTTNAAGALVIGMMRGQGAGNFAPGTGFTQADTDFFNGIVEFQIVGAAGTYDTTATSAATEAAFVVGVAIDAAAAATGSPKDLNLLGVGR